MDLTTKDNGWLIAQLISLYNYNLIIKLMLSKYFSKQMKEDVMQRWSQEEPCDRFCLKIVKSSGEDKTLNDDDRIDVVAKELEGKGTVLRVLR